MSAIDDLNAALEKSVGANATAQGVTQYIDTGFPPLNKIISGKYDGGLPFGRMLEMFGDSSTGKCLTGDTTLLTERGMLTISELYRLEGFLPTCVQKDVEHSVGLINENGEIEQTSHFVWNGRRKFKRIKLKSGGEIEATHKHPIRVITERGEIAWRFASEIKIGDHLPTMRGTMQFGKEELSEDEAKLIGYIVADGSCNNKNRVSLSNSDDEVESEFKRITDDLFDKSAVTYFHKNGTTRDHTINSEVARKTLETKYGIKLTRAAGKEVPIIVRMANKDAQVMFLRSYFELECSIESGVGIEVTSASKKLLDQIRLMLLNIGITSSVNKKVAKNYPDNDYFRLNLSGANYDRYMTEIGFETTARIAMCGERKSTIERTCADSVPNIHHAVIALYDSLSVTNRETNLLATSARSGNGLGYNLLEKIIETFSDQRTPFNSHLFTLIESHLNSRFFFDRVIEIEDDEGPTFDVVMPKTHSFWSNGVISHNTALATQWMINAQKMGGVAIFVDWEKSFDVDMAVSMGLNVERPYWIYCRPRTWEEGNMTATKACQLIRKSKVISDDAPIIAVFDSIAAAIPKSSDGKEIDELTMNDTSALSRVTSTTLKTQAQYAGDFNATFLYLNQTREKIGVMFGDKVGTPGGKAMEFYSTARLRLSRSKVVKTVGKEKEMVGQDITINCIKSKLTAPFKKCTLRLSFDEDTGMASFNTCLSLVEYLIDKGTIEKEGTRYVWEGGKFFKDQLAEKITASGDYEKLVDLIKAA